MKTTILALLVLCLTAQAADAAVLAHWRFESGAFTQGTGPNIDLANSGGTPTQVTLPASGAGSAFPDPIPLTSAANGSGASVSAAGTFTDVVNADPYNRSYWDSMRNAFTVELFFSPTDVTTGQYLVSRWGQKTGELEYDQQWGIGLRDGSVRIATYATAASGGGLNQNFETLTLATGKDYYLAVTYSGGSTRSVTARLDNLTDGGSVTETETGYATILLYAAHDIPVRVGGLSSGTAHAAGAQFTGLIDEVRLSNNVLDLATEGLLVPEPTSLALLGLGGLALVRRRRA